MAESDIPPTDLLEARAPEYEALQDSFERLYETICSEGITATLYCRKLLLKVEADTVRSKATTHEKNEELLFAISRRSPAQVLQFCQFLLEKQSHCGNILKEGMATVYVFAYTSVLVSQFLGKPLCTLHGAI